MYVILVILSCLLWVGAIIALRGRQIAAPILSFCALVVLSVARKGGYPLLPINTTMLTGWLVMTLVVVFTCYLQPPVVRAQTKGWGYMAGGALAGMAVGLLGNTLTSSVSVMYGIMVIATVAGTAAGFLLYTNTPDGRPVAPRSGHFFKYLLAKGFPTAITVMQAGVPLVLLIAVNEQ